MKEYPTPKPIFIDASHANMGDLAVSKNFCCPHCRKWLTQFDPHKWMSKTFHCPLCNGLLIFDWGDHTSSDTDFWLDKADEDDESDENELKSNVSEVKSTPSSEQYKQTIILVCRELWALLTDGDEPNLDLIKSELLSVGIDPKDVFDEDI